MPAKLHQIDLPISWADNSQWILQPQQDRSRQTMEKILDAAARLFLAKGYEGATMADVAREAAVSPGSIYRRFADKDALLYTVIDGYSATRIREFDQLLVRVMPRSMALEEILTIYNQIIFSAFKADWRMLRLLERRALVDAFVRQKVQHNNRYVSHAIAEKLAQVDDRPLSLLQNRMAAWHDLLHGALVYSILADGQPSSHLSPDDDDFEQDMLNMSIQWMKRK